MASAIDYAGIVGLHHFPMHGLRDDGVRTPRQLDERGVRSAVAGIDDEVPTAVTRTAASATKCGSRAVGGSNCPTENATRSTA